MGNVFWRRGVIAQLGERLHGMQEVIGSIPISSTIKLETKTTDGGIADALPTELYPHRWFLFLT